MKEIIQPILQYIVFPLIFGPLIGLMILYPLFHLVTGDRFNPPTWPFYLVGIIIACVASLLIFHGLYNGTNQTSHYKNQIHYGDNRTKDNKQQSITTQQDVPNWEDPDYWLGNDDYKDNPEYNDHLQAYVDDYLSGLMPGESISDENVIEWIEDHYEPPEAYYDPDDGKWYQD